MRKLFFISLIAFGLAAQESAPPPVSVGDAPHRGTNYDPPPMPKPQPESRIETAKPEPEKPLFELPPIDWGTRETWVKLALLVGSILMARRAFNDMTD